MAIVLTPSEITALKAERAQRINSAQARTLNLTQQADIIQNATDIDNAEKKAFGLFDTDIVKAYEDEREAMDGQYVDNPVLVSELTAVGQLTYSNRMFPPIGQSKPIRISQFDGSPLVTTHNVITGIPTVISGAIDSEQYWIARQAERETWLQSGFGGTSPTVTLTTKVSAITPITTQIVITVTNPIEVPVFAVGNTFVVFSAGAQVGVKITNLVSVTLTPYIGTFDVELLMPGTTASNASVNATWAGFNNASRTAKVDSLNGYTYMLLNMIDSLSDTVTERISKLNDQITALNLNEDTSLNPAALINVNTSRTFLQNWQVTEIVSNTGLTSLSTERGVRSPQVTARIAAIPTAKAAYYNTRYDSAVNIADTSRGTSRILAFRISAGANVADMLQEDLDRIAAIEQLFDLAGVPY